MACTVCLRAGLIPVNEVDAPKLAGVQLAVLHHDGHILPDDSWNVISYINYQFLSDPRQSGSCCRKLRIPLKPSRTPISTSFSTLL